MKATSRVAAALAVGLGLTALFGSVSSASAQESNAQCGPSNTLEQMLVLNYGQQRIGYGVVDDNNVVQLFRSESGTFTIAQSKSDGESCLVDGGEGLVEIDEQHPFPAQLNETVTDRQRMVAQMITQQSQGRCALADDLLQNFNSRYQEVPVAAGVSQSGSVTVLLTTPEGATNADGTPSNDSWTMLSLRHEPRLNATIACVQSSGSDWETVTPDPEQLKIARPNAQAKFAP